MNSRNEEHLKNSESYYFNHLCKATIAAFYEKPLKLLDFVTLLPHASSAQAS
jgi:hypothetical protein